MYNIKYITEPTCRGPLSVRAPLGHIKGRARPLKHRLTQDRPSDARADTTKARIHSEQSRSQPLESTSNITHSGCRVLHSGGPNHSKHAVFIVLLHLDWANPSYPLNSHPLGLSGCTTPPGCRFTHHDMNSDSLTANYGVKQSQFTKPTSESLR